MGFYQPARAETPTYSACLLAGSAIPLAKALVHSQRNPTHGYVRPIAAFSLIQQPQPVSRIWFCSELVKCEEH